MTGAERDKQKRDDELRESIIDGLRRRGWSKDDAEEEAWNRVPLTPAGSRDL